MLVTCTTTCVRPLIFVFLSQSWVLLHKAGPVSLAAFPPLHLVVSSLTVSSRLSDSIQLFPEVPWASLLASLKASIRVSPQLQSVNCFLPLPAAHWGRMQPTEARGMAAQVPSLTGVSPTQDCKDTAMLPVAVDEDVKITIWICRTSRHSLKRLLY